MALRFKDSRAETKNYALRLLSYRLRSKKEMIKKLRGKGFDNAQINNTIGFLEKAGLIRDKALASGLFRNAVERKCLGRKGVELFLFRRGIERELIEQTLLSHTIEMEKQSAVKLVEKKLNTMKNYPDNVVRRRLWGMLQRRGFSADIINMAVNSIKL